MTTPQPAPFHADLADGPEAARAWWVTTEDGLRIRLAHYPAPEDRGTVLMFPGRTEYVEKYGRLARDFGARGYHMVAVDWRGQGLADRMLDDPRTGHVHLFEDYQRDVAAALDAARGLGLPEPFFVIGHSMGGAIALRAVMEGLPVAACAFTGPMWGIRIAPTVRPAAWALSWSSKRVGLSHRLTPGTEADSYIAVGRFDDNMLTTDPDMWDYMRRQVAALPGVQLGGPSMHWLHEALRECRVLARRPSPDLPCVTFVGTNERIVDVPRIHHRMTRWPLGRLTVAERGEHEILMERPDLRDAAIAQICDLFDESGGSARVA